MKAAVTLRAGSPEDIAIQERPIPEIKDGWVLIRIKAFGLNRSEIFTRRGESPDVRFPRVQGIECVGEIEDDSTGTYSRGQKVAAIMGGMGREFDGAYADYVTVPLAIVFPFQSELSWTVLGAIPEMFQTVSGSLTQALEVKKDEILLIRGGTSSIGMLSCQLAKHYGLTVISTTRNPDKIDHLKSNGADYVLIDDGDIKSKLFNLFPEGVDKVLELIGTATLKDSLKCIRAKGMVCMTGILSGEWTMKDFTPMGDIPSLGRLTVYMGEAANLNKSLLKDFIDQVAAGAINLNIDKIFSLNQIAEAHTYMESNRSKGKIVVVI